MQTFVMGSRREHAPELLRDSRSDPEPSYLALFFLGPRRTRNEVLGESFC